MGSILVLGEVMLAAAVRDRYLGWRHVDPWPFIKHQVQHAQQHCDMLMTLAELSGMWWRAVCP